MKYWKQGFYDKPIEGSVEIANEYYFTLLEGQSSGKEIKEDEHGYPVLIEHEYTIDELQETKIAQIRAYDKSDAVNSFILDGRQMWLDKATRVGLMNSISIEQTKGRTDTVIWNGSILHVMPIASAIEMLYSVEIYAIECNNVTKRHIASVQELATVEEIDSYDYMAGYPERLTF